MTGPVEPGWTTRAGSGTLASVGMTESPLEPGVVLADRFRMDATADVVGPGVLSGVDLETQGEVVAFEVPREWIKPVRHGVGIQHMHLAMLLADVVLEHKHILVAERVQGVTLETELSKHHRFTPVESVKCALRMAEAVETLHTADAAHGFVHPRSVIVEPTTRSGPVLAWAPPVEPLSSHRSPERGDVGVPSYPDDSWAVAAVLHQMLTGSAPAIVGVVAEADLEAAGVEDAALRACLAHALAADADKRCDLHQLKRELARWFVAHAGDQHEESTGTASIPPPLPPGTSSPPPPASAASDAPERLPARPSRPPTQPPPSKGRRLIPVLAVVGIVVGVGAAWAVTSIKPKPETKAQASASPPIATQEGPGAPAAETSAAQFSLAEVPVTGESEELTGDKTATCVAAHLPKGAFAKPPSFDWLCAERDPREGGGKLRTAVVAGAGGASVTDAMKIFSKLGWFEMAAFTLIRGGCCPTDAPAIELPEPATGCNAMAPALTDLAKAVSGEQALDEAVAKASETFSCEAKANRASLFRRTAPPAAHEAAAFRDLVKSLEAK
ncbi:MAG: hypothetical protein R3B13_02490 [Polyangiaceae bacterium]